MCSGKVTTKSDFKIHVNMVREKEPEILLLGPCAQEDQNSFVKDSEELELKRCEYY